MMKRKMAARSRVLSIRHSPRSDRASEDHSIAYAIEDVLSRA